MTAGLELVASSLLTEIAVDAIWEGKECGRVSSKREIDRGFGLYSLEILDNF